MITAVTLWLMCSLPLVTPFLHARQGPQRLPTTQLTRTATARVRPLLARALGSAGGHTSVSRLNKPDKLGVLFLNLGGPEKQEVGVGILPCLFVICLTRLHCLLLSGCGGVSV